MARAILLWALIAPAAAQQGLFHVGVGVSAPMLIHKTEPEYSEEARQARLEGAVVLYAVIQPDGLAGDLKVIRSLGLGLGENAIAAVKLWSFRPGEKEGRKVAVAATIEVNFRLGEAGCRLGRVAFQTPKNASRPVLLESAYPPRPAQPEQGSVTLLLMIDEQGNPGSLHVEKSSD